MKSEYPTTVWGVFADRSRDLAKGKSGAALAVTLAFVMPIYLVVIGIYGVGEFVRDKIELQNAADAAAYSAAVVQADYLSRMATINKAMAWTYVDLQKRSLDLAMDAFCAKVFAAFQSDLAMCIRKNRPCHMHVPGVHFNCGTHIAVNSTVLEVAGTGVGLPEVAKKFNGQGFMGRFLLNHAWKIARANIKKKGVVANTPKVLKYSRNIIQMMKKLRDLHSQYPKKIKETAQQIAIANMMECKDEYYVKVFLGDPKLSFFFLTGSESNEKTFISFADPTLKDYSPKTVFGAGTDDWIVRKGKLGFWRVYRQTKTHLYAEWEWFWTRWVHVFWPVPPTNLHLPPITPSGASKMGTRKYYGYNGILPIIKRHLPIGLVVPPAVPITLLPTFFGKSGSITVAIVRRTANPLALFAGRGTSATSQTAPGILSAFNPRVADGSRPEFMCAIASARAGYKQYEKSKEKKLKSSDYTIGYVKASKEKSWNLIETDWDAVMLPVKHAWSMCAGAGKVQTFAVNQGNILKDLLLDKKDWVDSQGKNADQRKLPDWEKLSPPGGLIADNKAKDRKLDWVKLRDYLQH